MQLEANAAQGLGAVRIAERQVPYVDERVTHYCPLYGVRAEACEAIASLEVRVASSRLSNRVATTPRRLGPYHLEATANRREEVSVTALLVNLSPRRNEKIAIREIL